MQSIWKFADFHFHLIFTFIQFSSNKQWFKIFLSKLFSSKNLLNSRIVWSHSFWQIKQNKTYEFDIHLFIYVCDNWVARACVIHAHMDARVAQITKEGHKFNAYFKNPIRKIYQWNYEYFSFCFIFWNYYFSLKTNELMKVFLNQMKTASSSDLKYRCCDKCCVFLCWHHHTAFREFNIEELNIFFTR